MQVNELVPRKANSPHWRMIQLIFSHSDTYFIQGIQSVFDLNLKYPVQYIDACDFFSGKKNLRKKQEIWYKICLVANLWTDRQTKSCEKLLHDLWPVSLLANPNQLILRIEIYIMNLPSG